MRTLLASQVLFGLLRAPDGHAKNFSVQILPEGRFTLTRLYERRLVAPMARAHGRRWFGAFHDGLPRRGWRPRPALKKLTKNVTPVPFKGRSGGGYATLEPCGGFKITINQWLGFVGVLFRAGVYVGMTHAC